MKALERIMRYGTKAYAKSQGKEWSIKKHLKITNKYTTEQIKDVIIASRKKGIYYTPYISKGKPIRYFQCYVKCINKQGHHYIVSSNLRKLKSEAKKEAIETAMKSPDKFDGVISIDYKMWFKPEEVIKHTI